MSDELLRPGNLVLYKQQPARISGIQSKKISIQGQNGQQYSVRTKDVMLLHPGPIDSLNALADCSGDIESAWELLAGEKTTLEELADLIYNAYTPATAWATWELVHDGLLFSGTPEEISVHEEEAVEQIRTTRAHKAAEAEAWSAFLSRAAQNQYAPEDERYLYDVVALAQEQKEQSRVLRSLGRTETPENAHAFLLQLGYWSEFNNPYPDRFDVVTETSDLALPDLPEEERRDLTHLAAYAIDDAGNQDPDDAVSWDNGRLWVHIADVAALVAPDSPADLEARSRGTNLYLPEQTVPMLPPKSVHLLGLGLHEVSPALSFGIDTNEDAEILNVEIVPSWVRVTRLSYDEVERQIQNPEFEPLYELARRFEEYRLANGAVVINLPEVKVRVSRDDRGSGNVEVLSLPSLRSRDLVREAMLMTGAAVASYAQAHNIPIPYSTQPPPDEEHDYNTSDPYSLSAMFALRKSMRPSSQRSSPEPHSGLGMEHYVQATSPLRRYLDLVVHQQVRSHLRGEEPLSEKALLERVGAANAVIGGIRRSERLSIRHWVLVYLMQNPTWQGEGIIVEQRGARSTVLIPELALETSLFGLQDRGLDSVLQIELQSVDLPALEARFRIEK
ncbi:MAG: RNB domain-containing ribonuclease [Chloroflexota bacterium]